MIGFPATLDRNRHRVLQAPNVPGIDGLSAADLGRLAHVPVYFERDVNLLFSCDMLDLGIPPRAFPLGSTLAQGSAMPFSTMAAPFPARMGFLESWGTFPAAAAGKSAAAETWLRRMLCLRPQALPSAGHIFSQPAHRPAVPGTGLFPHPAGFPGGNCLHSCRGTEYSRPGVPGPGRRRAPHGRFSLGGAERENFSPHPKPYPAQACRSSTPRTPWKTRAGGCCPGVGAGSGKEGGAIVKHTKESPRCSAPP